MAIDHAGQKLIAERNGVRTNLPDGTYRVSQSGAARLIQSVRGGQLHGAKAVPAHDKRIDNPIITAMQTNRQARQVLGIAATYLRKGYAAVETIPSNFLMRHFDGTTDLAAQARSLLDRANAYAQKVYASVPDNDEPVTETARAQVRVALRQASSDLQLVSTAADNIHQGLIDDLIDTINSWIAGHLPGGFPKLPKLPPGVGTALLVVLGLTGLVVAAKLVHTVILGAAELNELGEAEMMAMSIADAMKAKKNARKVLSIA